MRHLRIAGLMVITAVIGTSLLNVAPAMAKNITLCKENVEECPEKSRYPAGTEMTHELSEGTKVVFKSAFRTVECSKSTMLAETENSEGSEIDTEITEATFGGCKAGSTECSVSAAGLGWWGAVTYWSFWYHYAIWQHFAGARPQVEISCGGVACVYGNEPIGEFVGENGAPGTISAEALELKKDSGSFLCSSTATLTATYVVTAPNPMYVTEVT